MTIEEIWEALVSSEEETIILAFPNSEAVAQFRRNFSVYKSRILKNNPSLVEILGDFTLSYSANAREDNRVELTVAINRTEDKKEYNVLLLPIGGTND